MTFYDDPNREVVGLAPIWTGAGEAPEGSPQTDPGAFTIADVKQWVDENDDLADEVLAAETLRGSQARATLITWLEGFIASRDDP